MTDILISSGPISKTILAQFAEKRFGDMVKGVIDIKTGDLALGGDLHADEESLLLQKGSLQENLWGINIYTDSLFPDNIEFDSLINIRPSQNNKSRFVEDPAIRDQILTLLKNKLL